MLAVAAMVCARALAADHPPAPTDELASRATAALDELDAWLGGGANGDAWRSYLKLDTVHEELKKDLDADPAVVVRSLHQFRSGAKGLDLPKFAAAERTLAGWVAGVRMNYGADLAKLAWSARADFVPLAPAGFEALRADLRVKARNLEQYLGGPNSPLLRDWKKFLEWDLLEPHLAKEFSADRRSLGKLGDVLRRLHANEAGLELPPFVALAKAIAKYRTFMAVENIRDPSAEYERLLVDAQQALARHFERPTTETALKVGRLLVTIESLGQSPELMSAIHTQIGHTNAMVHISTKMMNRRPEQPLNQTRPVHDVILGTRIHGTADTTGDVRYESLEAPDHVELALYLNGEALSRTVGYNGPVRINAHGQTNFSAVKYVTVRDVDFSATPAVASADTHTQINCISKTGGQFAHRLVEKIAWERAGEQKHSAEAVSSRHTQQRVATDFDAEVAKALTDARGRYEREVRNPLVRRGYSPGVLKMRSDPSGAFVESVFAAIGELGAGDAPPQVAPDSDLFVQIHESAVNNYLPVALAAVTIAQETAGIAPELKGNVPPWLKVLAVAKPKVAAAAKKGVEIANGVASGVANAMGHAEKPVETPPKFKPWSITLSTDAPATVHFDDGKLTIRIRAATLSSEDDQYENWDFIVTYKIVQEGNRILLRRVGDIEVFPSGFDPAWDKQMSTQKSGFRSTLSKNMNLRAKAGQGFPSEIPIEPVHISKLGTMVLRQLTSDKGWLTIAWRLP